MKDSIAGLSRKAESIVKEQRNHPKITDITTDHFPNPLPGSARGSSGGYPRR
jgi:hypothetical protein